MNMINQRPKVNFVGTAKEARKGEQFPPMGVEPLHCPTCCQDDIVQYPRKCRACQAPLTSPFLDLGLQPLANSYLKTRENASSEPVYPLRVFFCEKCLLVQLVDFLEADKIFDQYAYFSSYSSSWLEHARRYVEMITPRLGLNRTSQVIEIASNDGYLLQYFKDKDIPVLGVEPANTVAKAAQEKGIETLVKFFGVETAKELAIKGRTADLIIGNNVLAHVPDIVGFVQGLKIALKPSGDITFEFPHLLRLIEEGQFDTIYHEHFSYFGLLFLDHFFKSVGLVIYDIDELPTHGGSLRIYACHSENKARTVSYRVSDLLARERKAQLDKAGTYDDLAVKTRQTKTDLLNFLKKAKAEGKRVAGYGAPAKGNTLLNYCGIKDDLVQYTVDISPHKQNHFLPGSHLAIYSPEKIRQDRPDYVLILPRNLKEEIARQLSFISEWDGWFVIAIPHLQLFA